MSSLANKYRPQTLDDVVAQEGNVAVLRAMVRKARYPTALLFYGLRGSGKTTCARILARAANCLDPSGPLPCGACANCLSKDLDIYEVDAASTRGIDEIKQLIEAVSYRPQVGRYKVYILDEAHMLTPQAMAAFLKTLEEPPKWVIFILATTDAPKLLPTIRSRCMPFEFRAFTDQQIVDRLSAISAAEHIPVENAALHRIAGRSGHSMRDALMGLEAAATYAEGAPLTEEMVAQFDGGLSDGDLLHLSRLLADPRPEAAAELLTYLNGLAEERGIVLPSIIPEWIRFLADAAVVQYLPDLEKSRPSLAAPALQQHLAPLGTLPAALLDASWRTTQNPNDIDVEVVVLAVRARLHQPERFLAQVFAPDPHQPTADIVQPLPKGAKPKQQKRAPADDEPRATVPLLAQRLGQVVEEAPGRTTIESRGGKLLDVVLHPEDAQNEFYILVETVKQLPAAAISGAWLQRNGHIRRNVNAVSTKS